MVVMLLVLVVTVVVMAAVMVVMVLAVVVAAGGGGHGNICRGAGGPSGSNVVCHMDSCMSTCKTNLFRRHM